MLVHGLYLLDRLGGQGLAGLNTCPVLSHVSYEHRFISLRNVIRNEDKLLTTKKDSQINPFNTKNRRFVDKLSKVSSRNNSRFSIKLVAYLSIVVFALH